VKSESRSSNSSPATSSSTSLPDWIPTDGKISKAKTPSSPERSTKFPGFTPVFHFPYIQALKILCRLKIYQTGATCALVPIGMTYLANETITPPTFGILTGAASFAVIFLAAVGEICRKVVGILYLSQDRNQLILSHLSFFGQRRDVLIDVKDIVPLSETSERQGDVFWKIYTYTEPVQVFYISTKYGIILDQKAFKSIISSLAVE
jgi:hypothetical protein